MPFALPFVFSSAPGSVLEASVGAGACAIVVGHQANAIARIEAVASASSDLSDFWRRDGARFPSVVGKFSVEEGYMAHSEHVARALLAEGFRVALVAAHDDERSLRIVYLFLAGTPERRVELHVQVSPDGPRIPSLAEQSFPASDPLSTVPNPDSDPEKFPETRELGDGHG